MNVDINEVVRIVISASKTEILSRFNSIQRQYKPDGSIVTAADYAMQQSLTWHLQQAYPHIALMGEEMSYEEQQRLLTSGQAIWCVDPVDGTNNFASGFPCFCVSLALIENGQVTMGVVYDPIRDECFTAQAGSGAFLNGQPLQTKSTGLFLNQTIAFIDYKRLSPELATRFFNSIPYGSLRSLGSIALELCWLAAGRGHIYLHSQQQLWDYAAAQLILTEAGGHACTLDGGPVFTNNLTPCSTLAALDLSLFIQWRDYLTNNQPFYD